MFTIATSAAATKNLPGNCGFIISVRLYVFTITASARFVQRQGNYCPFTLIVKDD